MGIRLGTRGSALALAQSRPVADALGAEVVVIETSGDRGGGGPKDKERWVDAIEHALLAGHIDVAVHSAKDVPGHLASGLTLVAAAGREDPRDALVGAASLDALPEGAKVGTTSPRRRAQLLARRPDLQIVSLAGNVDTRLRKLADGEADALVLAAAGLKRLGRGDEIGALLDPVQFVPAPGQGTLALEAKPGFDASAVADADAFTALLAERELALLLGATCNSAVGIHRDASHLRAWAGTPDGSHWIFDELAAGTPSQLAERMRAMGASELIE
ncbi:MAG TPA: hydroxymethylbilane synthase [Baekduia sp.]|nr:hydroxymethylbilane synthase [Baekduia sp.]